MPGRGEPDQQADRKRGSSGLSSLEDPDLLGLFEALGKPLLAFFLNRRVPQEDARDLVQETFVHALRGWGQIRSRDKGEQWLFRIARNAYARWWRYTHADKRRGSSVPLDELAQDPGAARGASAYWEDPSPLGELIVQDRHRWLRDALGQLSEELRDTVWLRVVQERSYDQIAQLLDIPLGTVRSRLSAAKGQLRARLGEDYDL